MVILIPAYEPDLRLINLISELKANSDANILIVDDGSGKDYSSIYKNAKDLGCHILFHQKNLGKGRALKTGFAFILENTNEKDGVITADADGQHRVKDILNLLPLITPNSNKIALGERKFSGKVPIKSTIGNSISRGIFTMTSGESLFDTQTGLRGFPIEMLPWLLSISGERFEYEMNMLLYAKEAGYGFSQVEIDTVYTKSNKSTHFRTFSDSVRVMLPFVKFCGSGLSAALIDYSMLFLVQWLTQNLFLAVVVSRASSSMFNYFLNKHMVFGRSSLYKRTKETLLPYYVLVITLMFANYFLLSFLSQTHQFSLLVSKVITELVLFSFSYTIQHYLIFKPKKNI